MEHRLVGEVAADLLGVTGLGGVVELGAEREAELADPPLDVVVAAPPRTRGCSAREVAQEHEVRLGLRLDAGPLHLHHDGRAVGERGRVDLPDGGRRQRLGVEVGEEGVERLPQLGLDDGADGLEGHGRRVVLETGQLRRDFGRDEVGPRAQHLPQLDGRDAEVFEGEAEVLGPGVGRLARLVAQHPAVERDEPAEPEVEHEPAEPVAGQRPRDLAEPLLPRRRAHGRGRCEEAAHEAVRLRARGAGSDSSHPPSKPARRSPSRT